MVIAREVGGAQEATHERADYFLWPLLRLVTMVLAWREIW